MPLRAPFWWYRKPSVLASALAPLGTLYGRMAEAKTAHIEPYRSRLPVICIGNFTVGGGGKTPTAIAVAKVLKAAGERPCFLTRGYGGKSEGPILVAKGQSAAEVGDETLLLYAHAPTVISADRAAGAKLIEGTEATVIIMDDGFQNPQLAKDFSLIVVDSSVGLGNGLVVPAGPLRARLDKQMPSADALLLIGDAGKGTPLANSFEALNKSVLKARMTPRGDARAGQHPASGAHLSLPSAGPRLDGVSGGLMVIVLGGEVNHRLGGRRLGKTLPDAGRPHVRLCVQRSS